MASDKPTLMCVLRDINPWGYKYLLETLSSEYKIFLILFNNVSETDKIFIENLSIECSIISQKGFVYRLEYYLKILTRSPKTTNFRYGIKRDLLLLKGHKKWLHYFLNLIAPKIIPVWITSSILGIFKTSFDRIIHRINPAFILSVAFLNSSFPLIRAKKLGYKVYVIVYSWDNPFKFNFLPTIYDKYFVWNKEMSKDLKVIHRIPVAKQIVIGALQFDYIFKLRTKETNNISYDLGNLNISGYYLYLFSLAYNGTLQEIELVKHFSAIIYENDPESIVIARPYPNSNNLEIYSVLENLPNVRLDKTVIKGLYQDNNTIQIKHKLIKNSKAVINLGTTMGLEASFYGIPIIQINYIPACIAFGRRGMEKVMDMDYILQNDHLKRYLYMNEYNSVVTTDEKFVTAIGEIKKNNIDFFNPYSVYLKSLANPDDIEAGDSLLKHLNNLQNQN